MGFGPGDPKDLGAVARAMCPNCRNAVVFHLVEVRNWFRLFLVPMVPGSKQHYLSCPTCQYAIEVDPVQDGVAEEMVSITARWRAGAVSDADYTRRVDAFWTFLGGDRLE
jgi:hypothetical protein